MKWNTRVLSGKGQKLHAVRELGNCIAIRVNLHFIYGSGGKGSLICQGFPAWRKHRNQSCPTGHRHAETESRDLKNGVTSVLSLLRMLSARVARRSTLSALLHRRACESLAS